LFQVKTKSEENAWELDKGLAEYVNKNCTTYIPDKDIQEAFLEESPVPSNIMETPKLDLFMESYLREKASYQIKKDKSLQRISTKMRDVIAPLSKIWQLVEDTRTGKNTSEFDIDMTATLTQQSITLIGQAINATNFHRRKSIFSALNNGNDSRSGQWIREIYSKDLEESDSKLFGDKFLKSVRSIVKSQNKTVKELLAPTKPFPQGSSTNRSVGERKLGRFTDSKTRKQGNPGISRGKNPSLGIREGSFFQQAEQKVVGGNINTTHGKHTPSDTYFQKR